MPLNLNLKSIARRTSLATAALALAVGFAGCKDTSEAAPETGRDYYPVAVGNYWTYAVADTTWSEASAAVPSVAMPSAYQFKETITEVFSDVTGQPVYRMVRSKMVPPATAFRDDSVFVLTATPQSVILNRNNLKTLELIFPVKDGRIWNFNAYNNNTNDTITAETRQYSKLAQPFTTGGKAGIPVKTYDNTLTTTNTGTAAESSLLKSVGYQQVFAKGVGPVFRRRFHFTNFYLNNSTGVTYVPGSYFNAATRTETLIDYHLN